VIEDVGLQCDEGSGVPLVGSILAFQQSCSTYLPFFIIDNDPFDEFNPVPDSADWTVLLQVSATELNGAPVPEEIGHAYVHVVDDVVPGAWDRYTCPFGSFGRLVALQEM
jgi:hypothetical protein